MNRQIDSPLFCPRPQCPYYDRSVAAAHRWYSRYGWFHTRSRGLIRRFRCSFCGKTCSSQTFSLDYWTHHSLDYRMLFERVYSGSGLRQLARFSGVSFRVIQNRLRHLSRNCLALMDQLCRSTDFHEDLTMDGFESFTRSQYFPHNITLIVGADSQFIHAAVHTLKRRSGRMSERQKRCRSLIDAHWRPAGSALRDDCRVLLSDVAGMIIGATRVRPITLSTDCHRLYPSALRQVPALTSALQQGRLIHRTLSSRAARTVSNPLFAVNYVERQIRKNMAEHVRQTVQQGREVNCQMERMALFMAGHNYLTPHRVRPREQRRCTHAQVAGIDRERYQRMIPGLFTERYLWGHCRQSTQWQRRIWQHEYENPPAVDFRTGRLSSAVVALPPRKLPAHFLA